MPPAAHAQVAEVEVLRPDGVAGAGEVAVTDNFLQLHLNASRQQRRSTAEGDRGVLHPDLVQQPRVNELTSKFATAEDPDRALARRSDHPGLDVGHVPADEVHVGAGYREVSGRKNPRWCLVGPGSRRICVHLMVEDPHS